MASGIFFQFDASHHAVLNLLVLGTLVLPLARVPLLKLQEQRATTVLQSCVCHLAHLSRDLYSKGSSARIATLGSPPGSRFQNGSRWTLCGAKKWSCEIVGDHQWSECNPVLCCVWEALFSWLLIWHFMASGICFEFDASHHVAADLLVLGAIATTVLQSCAYHLAHLSRDLYSKGSSARIATLGSPPGSRFQNGSRWTLCGAKKWSCEVVGSHQFSQAIQVLHLGRSGFSDCCFDISRPVACFSSSTPAAMQW